MNGYLNSIAIAVNQIKDLALPQLDAEAVNNLCCDVDSAIERDEKQVDELKHLRAKVLERDEQIVELKSQIRMWQERLNSAMQEV